MGIHLRKLACALVVLSAVNPALAQPADKAPRDKTQPADKAQGARAGEAQATKADDVPPSAAAGATPGASDDPMLVPAPPPKHVLGGWREALALASAKDPDYSVSLLEVERSRGDERVALAGALPTLTATGNVTVHIIRADVTTIDTATGDLVTKTIPSSPTASASLSLRQPLLAPREWWAIGTASMRTDLAKMSIDDRRRVLIGAVADAIVTVVTAERTAEINRVGLKAALDRLTLEKKRLEIGSGTALDVVRFQQDVVAARATLIQGDETLRQARERLGLALGSTDDYGVQPGISLDGIQSDVMQGCKTGKLEDRSDLAILRLQRDIAARAETDADLMYSPTADLTSTATFSSEPLVGDGHVAWSVSGVLTIPIWDGGARYGFARSAKASTEEATVRLDAAKRGADVEVSQADRAVRVAEQSLSVAAEARDLAKETDRLAKKAFDNGDGTSFDLVDAARRLREAELSLTVRELDLVRAKISAILATADCKD
ncbi:MAG TPA: TolC family protein [Polyangiaceae bacterium]|jgi:outer membrane protein TolC|nr:TolC family protein [Polyangiaceae bacterium]